MNDTEKHQGSEARFSDRLYSVFEYIFRFFLIGHNCNTISRRLIRVVFIVPVLILGQVYFVSILAIFAIAFVPYYIATGQNIFTKYNII